MAQAVAAALQRARRINQYLRAFGAQGFRSGALYRNLNWYGALDISYDMSVPNVAHLEPQRGGCCTVMPYFIGDIVELPLTMTQDYSLFHIMEKYSMFGMIQSATWAPFGHSSRGRSMIGEYGNGP